MTTTVSIRQPDKSTPAQPLPAGRKVSAVVIVLWLFVRRSWSAFTQPGTGGLVQPGDWRCRYKDGNCTYWMSHGDAANMRAVFGGQLEWRGDFPPNIQMSHGSAAKNQSP